MIHELQREAGRVSMFIFSRLKSHPPSDETTDAGSEGQNNVLTTIKWNNDERSLLCGWFKGTFHDKIYKENHLEKD